MKLFFSRPKDERVQAEVNKIYRLGFLVLTFGILIDVLMQFTSFDAEPRPMELISLLGANILCAVLMVYKGFGDDNRFAEVDRFPRAHYLGISALAGLSSGIVCGLLLCCRFPMENTSDLAMILAFSVISIFLVTTPLVYAAQYLCFFAAKKRRARIEKSLEEEE